MKHLLTIVLLLLTIDTYAGPVNFKEWIQRYENPRDALMDPGGRANFFAKRHSLFVHGHTDKFSTRQSSAIREYLYDEEKFDFRSPNYIEDRALALDEGLEHIDSLGYILPIDIYSPQLVKEVSATDIVAVGDYVVANGAPWTFTESRSVATGRLGTDIAHTASIPKTRAVMYRVDKAQKPKPIAAFSDFDASRATSEPVAGGGEIVYKQGSVFKVKSVSGNTIDTGILKDRSFYEINLEEVNHVEIPSNANVFDFRGGVSNTPAKLSIQDLRPPTIPKKFRVPIKVVRCDGACGGT